MKRISRDDIRFDVLELFSKVGRKKGYSLRKESDDQDFIKAITSSLQKGRKNPIVVYGKRIETMFAYVVASLGECIGIKEEDSGELYIIDTDVQIPDYRLILKDSTEIFIEVKNCHSESPSKGYSFTKSYIDSLIKYSEVFRRPLFIAIYWSSWNLWTLIAVEDLPSNDAAYSINMLEAIKMNQMALLGDFKVGTVPPLELKLISDPTKSRTVNKKGEVKFMIASYEFYCNNNLITEQLEQNLAFYFMLYGDWVTSEPVPEIRNKELISVTHSSSPETMTPNQGFEVLGTLSSMVSRQFNETTTSASGVERFAPNLEPESFGVVIQSVTTRGKIFHSGV